MAGAAPNGSPSSVKPGRPAAAPAAKPKAAAPSAVTKGKPRPAPRPADDGAQPEKNKKSVLPFVLLGCGALFLLCGGGASVAGYYIYKGINKAANDIREQVKANDAKEQQVAALRKAAQEEQNRRAQFQKDFENPQKKAPPGAAVGKGPPPQKVEGPLPTVPAPDEPKDPDPPAERGKGGAGAIPLASPANQVFAVLFTGAEKNQAVVVHKPDAAKPEVRLERFDLATGRKVDGTTEPYDWGTTIRDVSPDAAHYLSNHAGNVYSIRAWPSAAAVVSKWRPGPPAGAPQNVFSQQVMAAYLLAGGKLVTINGGGQVVRWAIPAGGGEPKEEASYVPPPDVARYSPGLGVGLTAISPDRKRLAVYNGSDGYFVLDTDTLRLAARLRGPEEVRPAENAVLAMLGAVFSPDGDHLAGMFHQQRLPGLRPPKGNAAPDGPTIVRWDVRTQQVAAHLTDPSAGPFGSGGRLGWWGTDHFWITYPSRNAVLYSWEKKKVVLRDALRPGSRISPGSPDGKCWYMVNGPDNKAVLKSVDLPADELKNAEQPLLLKADGIAGR